MRYCQACGYLFEDCVCDRVEPRREPGLVMCHCCGLVSADEDSCGNEDCSLYEMEMV